LLILLVCALFGSKQNDHQSTHLYPPHTALCDLFLFPEPKMALKRKRINKITMIAAKHGMHLVSFKQCTSQNGSTGGVNTWPTE